VAKHYGVTVKPCPPRRGNRKGVVEKANHVAAQRFWRTVPDDVTVEEAQALLDTWCATRGDVRMRATADGRATVATVAKAEPLAPMPGPYPAVLTVTRVVSAQALVSYRGNRYSVPPQLHGATVSVSVRLGGAHLDIATLPGPGPPLTAADRDRPARPGPARRRRTIRTDVHVTALEQAALAASTTARPHRSKQRLPPSAAAERTPRPCAPDKEVTTRPSRARRVVDLSVYAAAAAGRNTLTPPPEPVTPNPTKETNTP
jgi:hypothetical protein